MLTDRIVLIPEETNASKMLIPQLNVFIYYLTTQNSYRLFISAAGLLWFG